MIDYKTERKMIFRLKLCCILCVLIITGAAIYFKLYL